ncbi:MAG: RHS repeat-associated core domain-containing protein, partial [Candidatus Thiodiazotropha sp.]
DNNDRLTRADYPDATLDYGYDAAYNRTSESAVEKASGTTVSSKTFSYNNRNQVTSISDSANAANDTTYDYDANGNQTLKTQNGFTLNFVYDVRDRLVRVSQDATTLGQFRYDHAGMRIQKEGAQGIVRYTYDDGSVLIQTDDTGTTLAKYDYGPDRLLSLEQATEGEQFYHFDALGSVVNLSRPDGSLQARYQYDAWGNERSSTGSSWNRFAFTGHEKDEETGLYYFKARFYDPQLGRFLSQDRYLGETNTPPSLHRYLYAYSNPTVYVDLYGYEATPWYHQYVSEETDVWETKGETYDTGSDVKDSYFAFVDSINNLLKTAGNEVMALTALPERSWATTKGWVQNRNVSLREATGDFDSTISAIPIVSAARLSNIPRMLRHTFGRPTRQTAKITEGGRGALRTTGEVSDLPPVPELRKANSSITIEGAKLETAQMPTLLQMHGQNTGGQKLGNLAIAKGQKTAGQSTAKTPGHAASFKITRADGSTRVVGNATNGNMSAAEKATRSPSISDTEQRIIRTNILEPGETLEIEGFLHPCKTCQGKMRKATRKVPNTTIKYNYFDSDGKLVEYVYQNNKRIKP